MFIVGDCVSYLLFDKQPEAPPQEIPITFIQDDEWERENILQLNDEQATHLFNVEIAYLSSKNLILNRVKDLEKIRTGKMFNLTVIPDENALREPVVNFKDEDFEKTIGNSIETFFANRPFLKKEREKIEGSVKTIALIVFLKAYSDTDLSLFDFKQCITYQEEKTANLSLMERVFLEAVEWRTMLPWSD